MKAHALFLGTGGSAGVPMIGCSCTVCKSHDPNNKRLRPSLLLTVDGKKILIDAGPDFRVQALTHSIETLDGVLLTHTHFDHIAGLDDLRAYYLLQRKILPVLTSKVSFDELKYRYNYLFKEKTWGQSLAAQLDFRVIEHERGSLEFLDIPLTYMSYFQGGMQVTGYRFNSFAYISDIREYPETIFEDLQGVEILVLSALRDQVSPVHFTIDEAISFAMRVGAKKTWFMHISHEVDHATVNERLPQGIELANDGLSFEFEI